MSMRVLAKTGNENMPGVQLWETVVSATIYTEESFGIYMDKKTQKLNLYINSAVANSIRIEVDKI